MAYYSREKYSTRLIFSKTRQKNVLLAFSKYRIICQIEETSRKLLREMMLAPLEKSFLPDFRNRKNVHRDLHNSASNTNPNCAQRIHREHGHSTPRNALFTRCRSASARKGRVQRACTEFGTKEVLQRSHFVKLEQPRIPDQFVCKRVVLWLRHLNSLSCSTSD